MRAGKTTNAFNHPLTLLLLAQLHNADRLQGENCLRRMSALIANLEGLYSNLLPIVKEIIARSANQLWLI